MQSYKEVKELADAIIVTGNWPWFHADVINDEGIVCLRRDSKHTWYHPNGLVTVFPMDLYKGGPIAVDTVPAGIEYLTYKSPWKQYIVINGNDGQARYYLLPEFVNYNPNRSSAKLIQQGLTLMPHPDKLYVPVGALPDYEISIDRKLKNAAMAKWSDFFAYVETMWDLLPKNPANWEDVRYQWEATKQRPTSDDRESWYVMTQYYRVKGWSRDGIKAVISGFTLKDDLPYKVVKVPDIRSSHTSHWSRDLIKQLGMAGRLDDLPEA